MDDPRELTPQKADAQMLLGFWYPALRSGQPMQHPIPGPVTLRWRS